jgi:hypothetical protein
MSTSVADGEFWFPNAAALCERHGLVCLNVYDGHAYGLLLDGSEVLLSEILAKDGRPKVETSGDGKVATIKPAPRRTD